MNDQAQQSGTTTESRSSPIEETFFETYIDESPIALILLEETGLIRHFNKSARTLFHIADGSGEDLHISTLFPSLRCATLSELRALFIKRQQVNSTESIIVKASRAEGGSLSASIMVNWLGQETPTQCIMAINDNSEANEAVKERQKLQQHLEFQVRVRTAELAEKIRERDAAHAKLNDALEKLQQTQDSLIEQEKMASLGNLVAGVAHEINTPVGIGVTAASHLSEAITKFARDYQDGDITRGKLEQFVKISVQSTNILESNLRRASDLIRSFKQVAVDQTDEFHREIILLDYINEVILSLRPKLKKTSVEVSLDIDPHLAITTNPGTISQIITNLVMNSLIHGYEDNCDGVITISSSLDGDTVTLIYQDDGKGMDAETSRQVFEPFFTTKRGEGGSGLGMHVLYNLVIKSLSGKISCKSAPREGFRLVITFPQKQEL